MPRPRGETAYPVTNAKPSKTAQKRSQHALQSLGERLLELSREERQALELDERLVEAIEELGRMKSREAIRRQKQYIGKLMRDVDPQPIRDLLAAREAGEKREQRLFASAERWRTRLLEDSGATADELAAATGSDTGRVESLLFEIATTHNDRRERALRRELFREIRAALEAAPGDG